jgi:nucleoside-diphosphate-sugar epimerase
MKIGITGCTGGLGNSLTKYLISKNFTIKAFVRKTSIIDDLKDLDIEFIYGDISDPDSITEFVKGIDVCYHIAALVGNAKKEDYYKNNVLGTKNICEAILHHNPSCRLIYCSSIAIFRIKFYNKFIYSDYTNSKFQSEKIVNGYMLRKGLRATIIYPGYIYGPKDRNFLPLVIGLLKNNLKFLISGGEKNAPIIYINDLCELFYLAGINDIAIGKKYIGVKSLDIGVHDFIKIIADKFNYKYPEKKYPRLPLVIITTIIECIYKLFNIKSRPPLTMRVVGFLSYNFTMNDDLALRELGWEPKTSVKEGLEISLKEFK